MKAPISQWWPGIRPLDCCCCYSCEKSAAIQNLIFDVFKGRYMCPECHQILKLGMNSFNRYNHKINSISKQSFIVQKWKYNPTSLSVIEYRIIEEHLLRYEREDPDTYEFSWLSEPNK